ncbi:hypothetical protein SLA2020_507020 [Shorea laevis]
MDKQTAIGVLRQELVSLDNQQLQQMFVNLPENKQKVGMIDSCSGDSVVVVIASQIQLPLVMTLVSLSLYIWWSLHLSSSLIITILSYTKGS